METKQTAVEYLFGVYSKLIAQYSRGEISSYELGMMLLEAKHNALDMEQAQIQEELSRFIFPQNEIDEEESITITLNSSNTSIS